MMRIITLPLVAIGLVASAAPAAQNEALPSETANCEIHVWPAAKLNTLTEGAIWNNVVDSAVTPHGGRVREREVPKSALNPENQLALLSAVDLPTILHHPGAQVIVHDEDSKRRLTDPAPVRQTASNSPCYLELTVAKNFFNRSQLAQRTLRTLFILDDFGDRATPKRSFVSWGATPMATFPAKRPEQLQAADDELARAFKSNVEQFARYALAPLNKR